MIYLALMLAFACLNGSDYYAAGFKPSFLDVDKIQDTFSCLDVGYLVCKADPGYLIVKNGTIFFQLPTYKQEIAPVFLREKSYVLKPKAPEGWEVIENVSTKNKVFLRIRKNNTEADVYFSKSGVVWVVKLTARNLDCKAARELAEAYKLGVECYTIKGSAGDPAKYLKQYLRRLGYEVPFLERGKILVNGELVPIPKDCNTYYFEIPEKKRSFKPVVFAILLAALAVFAFAGYYLLKPLLEY